jgi:hypothetical protein
MANLQFKGTATGLLSHMARVILVLSLLFIIAGAILAINMGFMFKVLGVSIGSLTLLIGAPWLITTVVAYLVNNSESGALRYRFMGTPISFLGVWLLLVVAGSLFSLLLAGIIWFSTVLGGGPILTTLAFTIDLLLAALFGTWSITILYKWVTFNTHVE